MHLYGSLRLPMDSNGFLQLPIANYFSLLLIYLIGSEHTFVKVVHIRKQLRSSMDFMKC